MSKPTAAQKRLWGRIFDVGCMACRKEDKFSFPEIHHCKRYGRNDHNYVIPLCPAHHRPTAGIDGVLNRHEHTKEFAAKYGTDAELYVECMEIINKRGRK